MPAPRSLLRRTGWLAAATLVAACGGGGGGGGPGAPVQLAGIWGSVALHDQHLGRISEREPNDVAAQAYRLPPAFARTTLELAGNVASSAAWYGALDAEDVLRYRNLAPSDVALELTFKPIDPVGGGLNELALEVRAQDGTLLDEASGASPLTAAFQVEAGVPVYVHVRAVAGTSPYVVTLVASDPPVPPLPPVVLKPLPDAPSTLAAEGPAAVDDVCSEEHVLVRLKPGVDAAAWAERHGHTLGAPTGSGTCRVRLASAGLGAQKAAKGFAADPEVAWSEPDWRVVPLGTSNDARLAQQWNLRAVGAFDAWDVTRGDPGVVVGVLDSGILAHADLAGQVVPGYDFVSDEGLAADGDGRDADPSDPGDTDASNGLSLWHGTHVAALIAGRGDDAFGISGLAPQCRVMPLRVLGRRGGLISDVSDAILYACGQLTTSDGRRLSSPLRVLNLSLGTSSYSAELEAACTTAAGLGVLLVAATGNSGGSVLYPAALATVVAVGAADAVLRGASYSNRGPEVSICAPGGFSLQDTDGDGWPDGVLSAARDETLFPAVDAHTWQAGTSEACPHVAAAAALLLSVDPTLSRAQLRSRLEQSALDLGLAGRDDLHGWGLLQVHTALKRLEADLGIAPTSGPRLHLPMPGLRFIGLESLKRIPLVNPGGGTLVLLGAQAATDDGGDWLGSAYVETFPGADVSASHLEVLVDRSRLPAGALWSSGTLRLYTTDGAVGLVRVVVSGSNVWPRAGSPLRVVPIDVEDGGAPSITTAHPEQDYRYVIGRLTPGTYHVRAGEDLDGDGFSCEPFDICGWYGGATQDLALPLDFVAGSILEAIDLTIGLPPLP